MLKPRKKITRKELKRDPLMDMLYRLRHFWLDNKSLISRYGSIGLIVIIIGFIAIQWRSSQNDRAAAVVGGAFIEYGQGNYLAVIDQLSPYVDDYSGFRSFGNGLYLLARSEFLTGDTTSAEAHYRRYLDDYGKDPLLKSGALAALGIIAEGRGYYPEAAYMFLRASDAAPTDSFRRQYIIHAGRALIRSGQPGDALEILLPLLDEDGLDIQTLGEVQELVSSATALEG